MLPLFFYYLIYFCYYSLVLLYFLVLFIGFTILFQLLFNFIYSIFSKKNSILAKCDVNNGTLITICQFNK